MLIWTNNWYVEAYKNKLIKNGGFFVKKKKYFSIRIDKDLNLIVQHLQEYKSHVGNKKQHCK